MMLATRIIPALLLLAACRTPSPPAPTPAEEGGRSLFEARRRQGIDLFAVGHEPEWSLEIDEEGDLRLLPLEGDSLQTPLASFRKTRSRRTTRYELRQGDTRLRISLSKQPCRDNMSGQAFPLTATVEWVGPAGVVRTLQGCATRIR